MKNINLRPNKSISKIVLSRYKYPDKPNVRRKKSFLAIFALEFEIITITESDVLYPIDDYKYNMFNHASFIPRIRPLCSNRLGTTAIQYILHFCLGIMLT